jgi:hypothetical protein
MTGGRKLGFWALAIVALAAIVAGTYAGVRLYRRHHMVIHISGAVVTQNVDSRKQSPIANVEVTFYDGLTTQSTESDFTGHFSLTMRPSVKLGQPIDLAFRHPDYQPVDIHEVLNGNLYIVRMIPLHGEVEAILNEPEIGVTNVRVRYSTEVSRTENVGSAVKTFQIVNTGNVPCNNRRPCSPDGKWKAEIGSASIDAGQGNEFRDARITCIAGPCPFTRIDDNSLSRDGRTMSVRARNWSDTTTFLLQAEVFRSQIEDIVRQVYPPIFGRSMSFTLPATAVGPSIEADIDGAPIVFPLGPKLILSWARCQVRVEKNQVKDYRCELKEGYEFR